jgi:hypothetical protein
MSVRNLVLYEDIVCNTTEDNGNGLLRICTARVTKRDMEPTREQYLSACAGFEKDTIIPIPAGTYLFIQGFLNQGKDAFDSHGNPASELYEAAEALWLEFVWQEKEPADTTVYVRILTHEGDYTDTASGQKKSAGLVFQLLRRTC